MKILHLHYFGGAGGKFIANCLSMSGKVALPDYDIFAKYLEIKDIKIIESSLLDTIPPANEKRNWLHRELGCNRLFGSGINDIKNGSLRQDFKLKDMSKFSDIWLPVVTHTQKAFLNVRNFFADNIVFSVFISGDPMFIDHAIRLKWPEQHHCLDLDAFRKFNLECGFLNFDHKIPCWNPLQQDNLKEIEILAHKLEIKYTNDMASVYINKYQGFH